MSQAQVDQSEREDAEFDEAVALSIVKFMKQQQRDWFAIQRATEAARSAGSLSSAKPKTPSGD